MKKSDSVNGKKKKKRSRDEEVTLGREDLSDKATKKKKKKRVDKEVDAPKKKKKNGEVDGRTDRTKDRAQRKFDKRQAKLNADLDALDLEELARNVKPGERDYLTEFVWMFNSVGRLIRSTEKRIAESGNSRDVYALSTLISQQREIIADIRTLADDSDVANNIRTMVLQPMFNDLAQSLLHTYYQMTKLIQDTVKDNKVEFATKTLDKLISDLGADFKMKYQAAADKVDGIASGEVVAAGSEPLTKKKKKKKAG